MPCFCRILAKNKESEHLALILKNLKENDLVDTICKNDNRSQKCIVERKSDIIYIECVNPNLSYGQVLISITIERIIYRNYFTHS